MELDCIEHEAFGDIKKSVQCGHGLQFRFFFFLSKDELIFANYGPTRDLTRKTEILTKTKPITPSF